MKSGSGWRRFDLQVAVIMSSMRISLLRDTSIPGNRSPSKPKKISRSSATILGKLKSLRALRRIASS